MTWKVLKGRKTPNTTQQPEQHLDDQNLNSLYMDFLFYYCLIAFAIQGNR